MPKFFRQAYIPDYDMISEYDGSGRQLYIGIGKPGAAETDASWSIYKLSYDGSGRPLKRRYANGNPQLVHKWTEKTSKEYVDI